MAVRSDITILWNLSPRLIKIAEPSDNITIQDLHDTLRDVEDEPANLIYPTLISSAGKEDLGGGVYVGLTATLQNAQIMFERRTIVLYTGIITTADSGDRAIQVIDSSATFITNGVQRADIVFNQTDGSIAEVLTVDSETQLTVLKPTGGTSNNYDLGDSFLVYKMVSCSVSGGNLVAVDTSNATIQPIFPTFGTQVVRTSSSSATLQELQDIQYASFGGGVTVDASSSYSGIIYPTGTPRQPVNNLNDAVSIATVRGFNTLFIIGDITLDSAIPSLLGYNIIGESANKSEIIVHAAANVTNSEFSNATISGTLDGGNVISNCVINDINFVDGIISQCVLNGTVALSTVEDAHFLDCWSGIPGLSTPTIDCGGTGSGLALRNYNGGITLKNKSGPESVSIDLNSGQVILENTVIGGTIVLRGVGVFTNKDSYVGGANVVNQLISNQAIVDTLDTNAYDGVAFEDIITDLLSMAKGRIVESPSGTFTFYEQDNNTPRFVLIKTGDERQRA